MARLVARIKILPADADTNIDSVVQSLKGSIPQGMELKGHAKDPLAFGLNAVVGRPRSECHEAAWHHDSDVQSTAKHRQYKSAFRRMIVRTSQSEYYVGRARGEC